MASVPSIPQSAMVDNSSINSIPDSSIDMQALQQLAFPNLGKAPNTTVMTRSEAPVVNVPRASTYTPVRERQPVNDSSEERIRARHHNQYAGITNAIGAYVQKRSEEKTDALKVQITSVLAAQKRIAEAQTVLQNDPNNANAKAVLDNNKKIMEGILNGKDHKAIQKAFDISFTDPQKNKTPEVKAAQEAMKEFKGNTQQGHDINNPQEAAIAKAAGNPAPTVQATVPGNGPVLHQRPGVPLNPTSNTSNVVPANAQATAPTVPQGHNSSTPYADQFLGKQALELQANPQYEQYKAQQDKQQAEAAKLIPTLLNNETKKQIEEYKQGHEDARTDASNHEKYIERSMQLQAQLKMTDMRDKAAFSRVVRQGQDAMARSQLKVNASLGVMDAPGIKGTPLANKLAMQTISGLQTDISKETKDLIELQNQRQLAVLNKQPKETVDKIDSLINWDQWNLQQMVDNRQKFVEKAFGKPQPSYDAKNTPVLDSKPPQLDKTWTNLDPNNKGTKFVAAGANNGNVTKPAESNNTEVVGRNESDDEEIPAEVTDGDLNPDDYDQ